MKPVEIFAVPDMPIINPGDDLAVIIVERLKNVPFSLENGDIVVIAQKVVSKAEGQVVSLAGVSPSDEAREVARATGKDEHLVEVILRESKQILALREDGLLVTEQRLGFVCANAGVDCSNVGPPGAPGQWATRLPADPDASAAGIRDRIRTLTAKEVAVIINDTHGRAFREGAVGIAIGVAGLKAVEDKRGQLDLFGYKLHSTSVAIADELASAASMVMGQTHEATPVVIIRGQPYQPYKGSARELIRPEEKDVFRHRARPAP